MDADEILRRQPWLPEDAEDLPETVRNQGENIRQNETAIEYVEDDIESIRSLVSSARKGIWTLVIQTGVATIGVLAGMIYLLFEVLASG